MKKKNKKKYIIIAVAISIIIITTIIILIINAKNNSSTASLTTTTLVETKVSTQTIQKTLTGSGQITTSATEKVYLTTTKYFSSLCVEEGDSISEGDNILKYSNGTYLTAPYDCIISTYSVPTTGSICTSSNYVEVKNTKDITMTLSVNESEINSMKVGQDVTITVNAIDNKTYTGTISKIDAIGTYSSSGSTFTATINFENDGNVKLGMSASCTVVLEEAKDCIAVPVSAIQTSGDNKYVIVVKSDETTENVTVETGISNDNYVQIKSGLSGDETIKMLQTTSTGTRSYSKSNSSSSNYKTGMQGNSDRTGGMPSGESMGGTMSGTSGGQMMGGPGGN